MDDIAAERAVLAGLFHFGAECYADVSDVITSKTFTSETNQVIYRCLEHVLKEETNSEVDYPSIVSAAQSLGLQDQLQKQEERDYLRAVANFPVKRDSVRKLAAKIRKLEVARLLHDQHTLAQASLRDVTGDEPINHILGLSENPIYDLSSLLTTTQGDGPQLIGTGLRAYAEYLASNPRETVGISTGYPGYDRAIGGGLRPRTVNMIGARPKIGKAQPLDAVVQTPSGPKKMGDIQPGDTVCTPKGTSIVLSVHPQGTLPIYKVLFADGDSTECCTDHLWEVYRCKTHKTQTLSLKEMLSQGLREADGRARWSVKLPIECHRHYQYTPIEPYLLGVLIGDGCIKYSVAITNTDEELWSNVDSLVSTSYKRTKASDGITYHLIRKKKKNEENLYKYQLKSLGLFGLGSHDKFIPEIYKYNTRQARICLLRGLMDTDGYAAKNGVCEFTSVSIRLALDVKEVVNSLGGLCSITPRYTGYTKEKKFLSFRCVIRFPDNSEIFAISRKKNRCGKRKKKPLMRKIKSVEYVGEKKAQCIKLHDEAGLYLTDHHIVTHNTLLADNAGLHIAGVLDVPVLNLDTEMATEDHWNRMLAMTTGVPIEQIEKGVFAANAHKKQAVFKAIDKLEAMPYHYRSIAGQNFEETLAMTRRWVTRTVGLEENGLAKPCVIIFDYLKLMSSEALDSKNLAEFQVLGFMMTGLHNFMVKWGSSCLAFVQLNRDGIDRESTDVVSQSDRLIWLCSNFSIYKKKSDEEMAEESGPERWNRKLIPIVARHGAGLEDGDYINFRCRGEIAKITEGPTKFQRAKGGSMGGQPKGVIADDADQEPVAFGS